MAPQGRPSQGRQATLRDLATRSTMRAQEFEEGSSNPHEHVRQDIEDRVYDCIAQRLANHLVHTPSNADKRFGIERLKAL